MAKQRVFVPFPFGNEVHEGVRGIWREVEVKDSAGPADFSVLIEEHNQTQALLGEVKSSLADVNGLLVKLLAKSL